MKTNICVIVLYFLLISLASFCQSKLDAPLGLIFSSNRATVKSNLSSKDGVFDKESKHIYGTSLIYNDIKIGSLKSETSIFKFVDDKLFEVNLFFSPTHNNEIQDIYDDICKIIFDKYGKGESFRNFKYPYEDKADDQIIAMKKGYADITTFWLKFSDSDAITAKILPFDEDIEVKLSYQSGNLLKLAMKKQEIQNKNDF